jgi:hypothetical protein
MNASTDRAALAGMLHLPEVIADVRYLVRAMAPEGTWPLGPTTTQLLVWAPAPATGADAWWDAIATALGAPRAATERTLDAEAAALLVPEAAARWRRDGRDLVVAGAEYPATALETRWRFGWVLRAGDGLVMSFVRG